MVPNLLKTKTQNLHLRVCYAWKSLGGNDPTGSRRVIGRGRGGWFPFHTLYTPQVLENI